MPRVRTSSSASTAPASSPRGNGCACCSTPTPRSSTAGIAARSAAGEWVPEAGGVDFVGTVDGRPVIASSTDYTDHGGGLRSGPPRSAVRACVRAALAAGAVRRRRREPGAPPARRVGTRGDERAHRAVLLPGRRAGTVGLGAGRGHRLGALVRGPREHRRILGLPDQHAGARPSAWADLPWWRPRSGTASRRTNSRAPRCTNSPGGIDLLVEDEAVAVAAAKRYLSYYDNDREGGTAPDVDLDALAPDADASCDMHGIVRAVCDAGSVFELRPRFAPALLTCLARIGGRSVGVLANQPLVDDGAIDHNAATKIARFVELCDAYEYPMLALVDTPGCVANWNLKGQAPAVEPGLTRWHARPLVAHQQRTVPLVSVQVRRGRGLGPALMTGVSTTRGRAGAAPRLARCRDRPPGRLLRGRRSQRVRRRDRAARDARAGRTPAQAPRQADGASTQEAPDRHVVARRHGLMAAHAAELAISYARSRVWNAQAKASAAPRSR